MLPNISEIKQRRKKAGITQSELALKAGVSQSLVAKIEANKIEPSYSAMQKLFEVLDYIETKQGLTARDIMNKRVITVEKENLVSEAIKTMKKYELSQIPVTSLGLIVGSISEKSILDKVIELEDTNLSNLRVEDVMDDAYPTINEDTPLKAVLPLLKHNQAAIITKKEKILGIITKADLLKVV
ncbi:MAG: CBS domain-containing protein [archaeon]